MNKQSYIDPDMRELLDVLGMAINKRRRRPVVRPNLHAPYYSSSRWKRVA